MSLLAGVKGGKHQAKIQDAVCPAQMKNFSCLFD